MRSLLTLDYPATSPKLRSIRHYSGIPIDARYITNGIVAQEKEME